MTRELQRDDFCGADHCPSGGCMRPRSAPGALRACACARGSCPSRQAGWADVSCRAFPAASIFSSRRLKGPRLARCWWPTTTGASMGGASGDLVVLELLQAAGLDGVLMSGLHRDTANMQAIRLPRLRPGNPQVQQARSVSMYQVQDALDVPAHGGRSGRGSWRTWSWAMTMACSGSRPAPRRGSLHACPDDPRHRAAPSRTTARAGLSLRSQVRFNSYLAQRQRTPSLSFSRSPADRR